MDSVDPGPTDDIRRDLQVHLLGPRSKITTVYRLWSRATVRAQSRAAVPLCFFSHVSILEPWPTCFAVLPLRKSPRVWVM